VSPNDSAKSGLERALSAVRSTIPLVQRLLPLLDGNFAAAIGALMAPQHHPAPAPVQVDLEPVERSLTEVRTSNRELRAQVQEQGASLKRVEDHLERVREATDRNTLEQQELVEDLRSVGNRISTFAIVGLVLLLISLGLNIYFLVQLQHILR
jgi:septal ring factor EnvC (AmiA/AmiB activator)